MERWKPAVGDHVYHICEYNVMDIELKIKGLEGFRTYGIEVVESVVEKPYRWKSCGMGCTTVCEKREVGDNANNLFFWKPSDYGKRLFATREEAAAQPVQMTWTTGWDRGMTISRCTRTGRNGE